MLHQNHGFTQLVHTLQLGQLHGTVHACHLGRIKDLMRHHRHAVCDRKFDDIGQVILVLGIFVLKACQPVAQQSGGHGHDAAVNFIDFSLVLTGIFVLDNRADLGRCLGASTHDAAITRWVRHAQRQQRQPLAVRLVNQCL